MKTLFLDFDGVLHPDGAAGLAVEDDGHDLYLAEEKLYVVGEQLFCWLPLLDDMLRGREVDLVIHSSWRLQFPPDVLTPHFPPGLRERIRGTTQGGNRFHSILDYVAAHGMGDEVYGLGDYLVLDDQPGWFPSDWPPIVACDPAQGITHKRIIERVEQFVADAQSAR